MKEEKSSRAEVIARFHERVAQDLAAARTAVAAAIASMTGEPGILTYQVSWSKGVAEDNVSYWLTQIDAHLGKLERGELAGAKTIEALIEHYLKQTKDKAMYVSVSSSMFSTAVSLVHQDVARSMHERFSNFKLELEYADKEDAALAAEAKVGIIRTTIEEQKRIVADPAETPDAKTAARKVLAQMRARLREHHLSETSHQHALFWVDTFRDSVLGLLAKDELNLAAPTNLAVA